MTSKTNRLLIPIAAVFLFNLITAFTVVANSTPEDYLSLATNLCQQPEVIPDQLASHEVTDNEIIVRKTRIGTEKLFTSAGGTVKLEIIEPPGRSRRTALTTSPGDDITEPRIWMVFDRDCSLMEARQIIYSDNTALYVKTFDQALTPMPNNEWLNPPLPEGGKSSGLRVALIDSGVNYQLEEIARSLAIDENGKLAGYDFWDNDQTPFDANPARSPFFVQRHGTRTASILLREAPDIALVPYRYPRPDMSRMTQLVEHAAANEIRIIGMPLGSNTWDDWIAFSGAVEKHPEILFVVSAGNNGRDIDLNPVYPAALEHPNILVVTSADDYVRPAERTNFGKLSVDYMLPAENIVATDFDGTQTKVSGSSYAVSRLTALAARLLNNDPDMKLDTLKKAIAEFSVKANTSRHAYIGYIGDPMADTSHLSSFTDKNYKVTSLAAAPANANTTVSVNPVKLNLVALDDAWSTEKISNSISELQSIYAQCDITIDADSLLRIGGANYLSNLSTGNALTLSRYLKDKTVANAATVFFAKDTDMQIKFDAEAFGRANTGNRPWMRDTVWISAVTPDTGIAVAHELLHVLTNSGEHSNKEGNLMMNRTSPNNTRLTAQQCASAIAMAKANGLMQ